MCRPPTPLWLFQIPFPSRLRLIASAPRLQTRLPPPFFAESLKPPAFSFYLTPRTHKARILLFHNDFLHPDPHIELRSSVRFSFFVFRFCLGHAGFFSLSPPSPPYYNAPTDSRATRKALAQEALVNIPFCYWPPPGSPHLFSVS